MTYITEMNSKYYCQTQNKLKLHKLTMYHHDKNDQKLPKMTKNAMKTLLETQKKFKFTLPSLQKA